MKSKSEGVQVFIERIVRESLNDIIADRVRSNYESAKILAECASYIAGQASHRAIRTYSMLELQNIMDWKKPRKV